MVAFLSVVDYMLEFATGFSFFDMVDGLKAVDRLGLGWYDEAIDWITKSRFFDDLASNKIGAGHAWSKHAKEYVGIINTQEEFVDLIGDIIRNPDGVKQLARGRKAYWDHATDTVVIFDPNHPDLGTAFRPGIGYDYFLDL